MTKREALKVKRRFLVYQLAQLDKKLKGKSR